MESSFLLELDDILGMGNNHYRNIMKIRFLFYLSFIIQMNIFSQTNDFQLVEKICHADFNYHFIDNIDSCFYENIDSCNIREKLLLSEGSYSIYVFERHIKNSSKKGFESERIDCIFQKTCNDTIVESIYIPLTWREPPISRVMLFSKKKIPLNEPIKICDIEFLNISGIEYYSSSRFLDINLIQK